MPKNKFKIGDKVFYVGYFFMWTVSSGIIVCLHEGGAKICNNNLYQSIPFERIFLKKESAQAYLLSCQALLDQNQNTKKCFKNI